MYSSDLSKTLNTTIKSRMILMNIANTILHSSKLLTSRLASRFYSGKASINRQKFNHPLTTWFYVFFAVLIIITCISSVHAA